MRTLLGAVVIVAGCGTLSSGQWLKCPVAADTWVAMHRWEGGGGGRGQALEGHGEDTRLVVKGRDAFALLQFDLAAAKGMTIAKATLRIWRKADLVPVHTVGLSTVSGNGPWAEKSANYFQPSGGNSSWSYGGSDLIDVTFAQGGSLYSYPRAKDVGDGWWEIEVAPALVHALLAGDQFGLMLTDEKGQTQARHEFGSRESDHPPVLLVEGMKGDRTAPGPVRSFRSGAVIASSPADAQVLGRTTLRPGAVVLTFGGAGDDGGKGIAAHYEVRYSKGPLHAGNFAAGAKVPRWAVDPLAPKGTPLETTNRLQDRVHAVVDGLEPGQVYHFAARATDEAGNAGPVASLGAYRAYAPASPALPPPAPLSAKPAGRGSQLSERLKVWAVPELLKIDPTTGALLEKSEFPDHRAANSVWHSGDSTVRLTGARNEFVAFQLAVESAVPLAGFEIQVTKPLFGGVALPEIFRSTGAVQLYREWFVPDDRNAAERPWYPDALIPLAGPLDLPAKDNAVAGQKVQPVFVDVYIPHEAPPGRHEGEMTVRAGGREQRIKLSVEVLPLRLPDKLNFLIELNAYSGVTGGYTGMRYGTPEYRQLEQAFHRVAHLHRANLDILGYSHTGTTVPDHAPPLKGEGAQTRVSDWTDWDAHFGPILDGSAFEGLPRGKVPIFAMYLPFFENWPGDLRRSYRFNDYPIAETEEEYREIMTSHALKAGPVEEAFGAEYQARFPAVMADFANHLKQKGWTRSQYLVYLNDKYYYKRPAQGGRGVSWWLLDEPNHRDDVRAISFFAELMKKGMQSHPDVPILFRTDISRVEWIRDLLAGQIDINCISRRFFDKNRYLQDDRTRFGKTLWNYASTNHPRETNVAMRAWCWRVWAMGGDGVLPWNAVAGARAWDRAEQLTVFYPGSKFGRQEPFASLRLKAYRRGQQDMEYLVMLAARKGWDRESVARAVSGALDLSGDVSQRNEEDAGEIRFGKLRDSDLEQLRMRVAAALTGGAR